jgi:hypothetical protein
MKNTGKIQINRNQKGDDVSSSESRERFKIDHVMIRLNARWFNE